LFANGAKPGGVLSHPGKLSDEAAKRLKASWSTAFSGENQHKTAVLEEGMEWKALGLTNEDSQFLETRRFQTEEIARIFRVPLHMIQSTEKSTSWGSGIESLTLGFVKFTLLPWLRRWEQAISRDLLSVADRKRHYAEFLIEGMERAAVETRYNAYSTAIQNGIMSPNEARRKENMDPRPGGDEFWKPSNMMGDKDGD
jgi:HK97 family phage portal protein